MTIAFIIFSFKLIGIEKKTNSNLQSPIECKEIKIMCTQSAHGEYVINNNHDYYKLLDQRSTHPDCTDYNLPQIDFEKYVLVGYISSIGGCSPPNLTKLIFSDDTKYYVNIYVKKNGFCKTSNSIEVWYLIPKMNMDVEFIIKNINNENN